MLDRQILANDLLERLRAVRLTLLTELVRDHARDEVLLRVEVGVERAVGQAGVRHERGDSGTIDAVSLEPAASPLDDPPPRALLVIFRVPSHARLPWPGRPSFPFDTNYMTCVILRPSANECRESTNDNSQTLRCPVLGSHLSRPELDRSVPRGRDHLVHERPGPHHHRRRRDLRLSRARTEGRDPGRLLR